MADAAEAPTTGFAPIKAATHDPNALSRYASIRPTSTRGSHKEMVRDPDLDVNLPYRTLSADANLAEYTTEKASGEIPGPVTPEGGRFKLVTFRPNDPENPKNWSKGYKWYCTVSETRRMGIGALLMRCRWLLLRPALWLLLLRVLLPRILPGYRQNLMFRRNLLFLASLYL